MREEVLGVQGGSWWLWEWIGGYWSGLGKWGEFMDTFEAKVLSR